MSRLIKSRENKKKNYPGYISKEQKGQVLVSLTDYNKDFIDHRSGVQINECVATADRIDSVTWVDIRGLSDGKVIHEIGKSFGIHALWLEDVLTSDHRPKLEELDDVIFCILKAISYNEVEKKIEFEQVSLFLGDKFVVSFQEKEKDVFSLVQKRLINMKGRIRESRADYLFYALIDTVIDDYFISLEKIGREVEALEDKITNNFESSIYQDISRLRNELIFLKKAAGPIKDLLKQCLKTEKEEIKEATKKYFKDAYDHILQVVETVDSYFHMLDSARDSFNSMQANKMNEVMKVLTVFASLFIPLTFVAGVYGMNFEFMPELKWRHGYLFFWVLTVSLIVVFVSYFKKKKWF